MTTIWKTGLVIADTQEIRMPAGAQILSIQMRDGLPYMWFMCDPDAAMVNRVIIVHGTGERFRHYKLGTRAYIGTVQDGKYVWHFFDGSEFPLVISPAGPDSGK